MSTRANRYSNCKVLKQFIIMNKYTCISEVEPVRIFWTGTGTGTGRVIFFRTGTGTGSRYFSGPVPVSDRRGLEQTGFRPAWIGMDDFKKIYTNFLCSE